jgi:ADP-heptose:LPS heptosyltransferase
LISSWRVRYPEDRIIVLSSPAFAAAFKGNPDIDELLVCDPPPDHPSSIAASLESPVSPLFSLIESLKKRKFRAVINLTHDQFSSRLTTLLRWDFLRGFTLDTQGKTTVTDLWSLYLLSFQKFRSLNLLNLVDIFAHFSGASAVRDRPRFEIDDQIRFEVAQWVKAIEPGRCFIGFQPGSSKAERRWPAENFVQLGRELTMRHKANILVFGTENEEPLTRSISDQIPNAQSFAGKTTLPQLAALLEKCQVLVTNDTGTMHLAAAVGIPNVALFETSAYFRETGPYGSGHWIIQSRQLLKYGAPLGDEPEMIQRIPVESVLTAVEAIMSHDTKLPALIDPDPQADHYISMWTDGVVDYLPVMPVPLRLEDLCARFQKPIWLASLNNLPVNPDQAADEALEMIKTNYSETSGPILSEMIQHCLKDTETTQRLLLKLNDLLEISLQKVRKNPAHCFSADQLSKITAREDALIRSGSNQAVQPFVSFFEIASAIVSGTTAREILINYNRNVNVLNKQLNAFRAVLRSADTKV